MVNTLMGEFPKDILAIVGSTVFHNDNLAASMALGLIVDFIKETKPEMIISGGAIGIDTIAKVSAENLFVPFKEYSPRNARWAPDGYLARNKIIAITCTRLLCVRHFKSKTYGSGWTADYAESLHKSVVRKILTEDYEFVDVL